MFTEPNALYGLLPAGIRARDQASGAPLQQLLGIAGDQAAAIERDLERMYDGWFIETCDEWLIPYLGELVGVDATHLSLEPDGTERGQRLRQVWSARPATANAIAHRRRKGTLWVLEEIARDAAHWPARAVEFYRRLVVATHLDHIRPGRPATADIRSARRLADLDGPFDDSCHIGDVRRIGSAESPGRYAIPNVGLFVWRLRPFSVTSTPAYCHEEIGAHCFSFSALGHDTQLFQEPTPETDRSSIGARENLPVPISRWTFEEDAAPDARSAHADPMLYGPDMSLYIEAEAWPRPKAGGPIAHTQVIPADLSDWSYKVPKDHVAVDPVLGRIAFPATQAPRRGVKVTYRYGFAMGIGGGEYRRDDVPLPAPVDRLQVRPDEKPQPRSTVFSSIEAAFSDWRRRRDVAAALAADDIAALRAALEALEKATSATREQLEQARWALREATTPPALAIELPISGIYSGRFDLQLRAGETVAILAPPGVRPVLWVPDVSSGGPDGVTIRGSRGSRVILDGLLIAGRAVGIGNAEADAVETDGGEPGQPAGELCEVWIRHSTLVPGNSLHPNCEPRHPAEPSVIVDQTSACLRVEGSIIGAIRILHEGNAREPGRIVIRDSIVDATSGSRTAIGGTGREMGYAELSVWRSTLMGRIAVHAICYAEDSIFASRLDVARRQKGCMRFCWAPPESRAPKRYECQPAGVRHRVAPHFESVRYGSPDYMRLSCCTPPEIRHGAHDAAEMGVYHDLFEPQRLAMLSQRLAGFVPASCDSAVVFAT